MTEPLAFRATYSDWRLIKTRGVVQVVMEVPLADADAAYQILGGMPDTSRESWFAVAPLKLPVPQAPAIAKPALELDKPQARAKHEKMNWREVQPAAQAGIRCAEPMFRTFLREVKKYGHCDEEDAAVAVRDICGVSSRAELSSKHAARMIWKQLDDEFQAWKAAEHA